MKTREFNVINESLFSSKVLSFFHDGTQFGFNHFSDREIKKVGYSINLTKEIIEEAKQKEVDLILTHHDVWDEMIGMRNDILNLLKEYDIIHYFNHLPLDASEFGPTRMLTKALGLQVVKEINFWDEFSFGVVGEFDEGIELSVLEEKLNDFLGHPCRVWKNNDQLIKTVGIVAGSASDPASLYEAYEHGCDAYITGEKKLKTILYAKHIGLNFLLGSHTFTERAGINEYARLLSEQMKDVEFTPLSEFHIE